MTIDTLRDYVAYSPSPIKRHNMIITDDEILALRAESTAAGDTAMADSCTVALFVRGMSGASDAEIADARHRCISAILDARAQVTV